MFFFFNFDNSKQDTNNYESVTVAICNIVQSLMENVMDKVLVTDPFVAEEHHAKKPLYAALVPDEIFKGSHFERRFVTPFGTAWERLAMAVGNVHHGKCTKGASVEGTIGKERLRRIQEVLNRLEHGGNGKIFPRCEDTAVREEPRIYRRLQQGFRTD